MKKIDKKENFEFESDFLQLVAAKESSNPEIAYWQNRAWTQLGFSLFEMPVKYANAIIHTKLEGLPLKKVAKTEGTSITTIQDRVQRGIAILKNELLPIFKKFQQQIFLNTYIPNSWY